MNPSETYILQFALFQHHRLRNVGGAALIVDSYSLSEVMGQADITPLGMRDALQEVNVFHILFNEAEEN